MFKCQDSARLLRAHTLTLANLRSALALLILTQLKNIELIGISTVYGVPVIRAKIAKKILDAANINVPVYAGEAEPILKKIPVWLTGSEGEGVLSDDEKNSDIGSFNVRTNAVDFIIDTLKSSTEKIRIVAIGPLTNIASALLKEPDIKKQIEQIFFGAYYKRTIIVYGD